MKKLISVLLSAVMLLGAAPAALASSEEASADDPLDITQYDGQWTLVEDSDIGDYYMLENVCYVANPNAPENQCMNIFVPAAYFDGGSVNGYTAETAPILFLANSGGYMSTTPAALTSGGYMTSSGEAEEVDYSATPGLSAIEGGSSVGAKALAIGYVVVSPGCRGRDTVDADGNNIGRGAAGLVDLKAAVRFLRHNSDALCGDEEKIVVCGHSAGGAHAVMLGVTGNCDEYSEALEAIGAADERDDVFAVAGTCPITDLSNGDMAYEWMRGAANDGLTEIEDYLSDALAAAYPDYVNSLALTDEDGEALTLDADGTGTYLDYVLKLLSESATVYLQDMTADEREEYLADKTEWLTWDETTQTAQVTDFELFAASAGRVQSVPQFDALNADSTANYTFGDEDDEAVHYTDYIGQMLADGGYTEEAAAYGEVTELIAEQVNALDPMVHIGECDTASYFWIHSGTKDHFAPPAVSMNIAVALECRTDAEVNYAMLWDEGHNGDIGSLDFFVWCENACRE